MVRRAHVLEPGGGRRIEGRSTMLVLAGAAETEGRFTMIETANPPHGGPPLHIHDNEDEGFLVLAGEYTFVCDGEETRATAGAFVLLPRGLPHRYRVGPEGGRVLMVFAPAGIEGYFEELGGVLTDPEAADAMARRFGISLLESY